MALLQFRDALCVGPRFQTELRPNPDGTRFGEGGAYAGTDSVPIDPQHFRLPWLTLRLEQSGVATAVVSDLQCNDYIVRNGGFYEVVYRANDRRELTFPLGTPFHLVGLIGSPFYAYAFAGITARRCVGSTEIYVFMRQCPLGRIDFDTESCLWYFQPACGAIRQPHPKASLRGFDYLELPMSDRGSGLYEATIGALELFSDGTSAWVALQGKHYHLENELNYSEPELGLTITKPANSNRVAVETKDYTRVYETWFRQVRDEAFGLFWGEVACRWGDSLPGPPPADEVASQLKQLELARSGQLEMPSKPKDSLLSRCRRLLGLGAS